jgi:hypothetical protein
MRSSGHILKETKRGGERKRQTFASETNLQAKYFTFKTSKYTCKRDRNEIVKMSTHILPQIAILSHFTANFASSHNILVKQTGFSLYHCF